MLATVKVVHVESDGLSRVLDVRNGDYFSIKDLIGNWFEPVARRNRLIAFGDKERETRDLAVNVTASALLNSLGCSSSESIDHRGPLVIAGWELSEDGSLRLRDCPGDLIATLDDLSIPGDENEEMA